MKTKKLYKIPFIKVIEIDQTDIIATSDIVSLSVKLDVIEEDGYGD